MKAWSACVLLTVLVMPAFADDAVQDYIDLLKEQGKPAPENSGEDIAKELNDIEDLLIIKEFIK